MSVRRSGLCCSALAALLAGCRAFAPPSATTLAALRPLPLAAQLQRDLEGEGVVVALELETPVLTGVFDLLGARSDAGLRLQLFPDVGGKVLDMTLAADGSSIEADAAGSPYRATRPLDAAEPHLALLLAALFGELLSPVTPARVLGERAEAAGTALRLSPAVGAGDVEVRLGADGAVVAYRIGLGVFHFELQADGSFVGRGLRGRVSP